MLTSVFGKRNTMTVTSPKGSSITDRHLMSPDGDSTKRAIPIMLTKTGGK